MLLAVEEMSVLRKVIGKVMSHLMKFVLFYVLVKEIHQEMVWGLLKAAKTPS